MSSYPSTKGCLHILAVEPGSILPDCSRLNFTATLHCGTGPSLRLLAKCWFDWRSAELRTNRTVTGNQRRTNANKLGAVGLSAAQCQRAR